MSAISYIPLSACGICKELPANCYANGLSSETLPPAAYKLEGMPEDQIYDQEDIVFCPVCRTPYLYDCDVGFMEHDISLSRATLPEARGYFSDHDYAELIQHLADELENPDEATQTYAARSTAHHHLIKGDAVNLFALLRHPNPNVCVQTIVILLAHCENFQPYIATLIDLLSDTRPNVCSNAIRVFTTYTDEHKDEIKWGGETLIYALIKFPHNIYGYEIAKIILVAINESINVESALPRLVELLNSDQPLAPDAAAETLIHFARANLADAQLVSTLLEGVKGRAASKVRKAIANP